MSLQNFLRGESCHELDERKAREREPCQQEKTLTSGKTKSPANHTSLVGAEQILTSGTATSLTSEKTNTIPSLRAFAIGLALAALLAAAAPHRLFLVGATAADSIPAFAPDKGKFRILQNGSEIGSEDFELTPTGNASAGNTWIARGDTVIHVPGSSDMRSSGQLRLAADGAPLHYEWTAQTDKKVSGVVEFENGTAKTSTSVPGKKPVLQDFHFDSPRIAVLDNNLYDQYAILARLYDWNAKGAQMFPVVIPQDVTPGTIKVESQGRKSTESGELETLRVSTSDLEVDLYLDAKYHLIRLEVPAAKVVIVRQ